MVLLEVSKDTESKNPQISRTKNARRILLSKCVVCDSKKSKFINVQKAGGLLSSLEIKTPLSKISLMVPVYFNSIKKLIQGMK